MSVLKTIHSQVKPIKVDGHINKTSQIISSHDIPTSGNVYRLGI